MFRSNSKSLGNHVVSPEEEKEGYSGNNFNQSVNQGFFIVAYVI